MGPRSPKVIMNRRTQRINALVRQIIGEMLLKKISDPRIDPARTSVTRVEVAEDLLSGVVYISVMGTESEQRLAVSALSHAAGHIQELMMREMSLRHTPILTFKLDEDFKKTLKTLNLIEQAMDEIRRKEAAKGEAAGGAGEEPLGGEEPGKEAAQAQEQGEKRQDEEKQDEGR